MLLPGDVARIAAGPMAPEDQVERLRREIGYPDGMRERLSGVSLEIAEGELIGLAGGSGAGKSTLGSVMAGLLSPGLVVSEFCPRSRFDSRS